MSGPNEEDPAIVWYVPWRALSSISGLVVEYIVAIDVTRVRFLADALFVLCTQRAAIRFAFQFC